MSAHREQAVSLTHKILRHYNHKHHDKDCQFKSVGIGV